MKRCFAVVCLICPLFACTTYIVEESSEGSLRAPSWTIQSKAHRIDPIAENGKYRYFVDTAQDANRRLCLRSAEVNATRKIASEVSQDIVSLFERTDVAGNNLTDSVLKDKIGQNILVNLNGVVVAGQYWEKRQYLKEKGAEKDHTAYKCDVVVKIEKGNLADAIEIFKARTGKTLSGESGKTLDSVIDSYVSVLRNTN